MGVDLSHVKVHGETSLTTALEFTNQDERVNVMMCDLGSLEEFGPDNLTPEDLKSVINQIEDPITKLIAKKILLENK